VAYSGGAGRTTALTAAASGGHAHIISLLLAKGARNLDEDDDALVMMEAASSGNIETVRLLLCNGCRKITRISLSPLVRAARCGHQDIVELLLEHRASQLFDHPRAKAVALQYAARYGFWSFAYSLLEDGAPPNGEEDGYTSPMNEALDGGHQHIVQLLHSFGAKASKSEK
jgi:ankyrin repeat protein